MVLYAAFVEKIMFCLCQGEVDCPFYLKTGRWIYCYSCWKSYFRKNMKNVRRCLNCFFLSLLYISCKYGSTCRYNHPDRNGMCRTQISSFNYRNVNLNNCFSKLSLLIYAAINPPASAIGHPFITSPAASLSLGIVNPAASIYQTIDPRLAQSAVSLMHLSS